MDRIRGAFAAFVRDEEGATAIEYVLLASLVGLGTLAGASALGDDLYAFYASMTEALRNPEAGW